MFNRFPEVCVKEKDLALGKDRYSVRELLENLTIESLTDYEVELLSSLIELKELAKDIEIMFMKRNNENEHVSANKGAAGAIDAWNIRLQKLDHISTVLGYGVYFDNMSSISSLYRLIQSN